MDERIRFVNNRGILQMPAHALEAATRNFKGWVSIANRTFPAVLAEEARKKDAAERERLRKEVVAEEQRREAVQRARKALGP
jgi:hypothetical protein